jgi:hypothetical protein
MFVHMAVSERLTSWERQDLDLVCSIVKGKALLSTAFLGNDPQIGR